MEPPFNVMFSGQSCISWPLKCDSWSLSSPWRYLYMIASLTPLWWQPDFRVSSKAWIRPHLVSPTNQSTFNTSLGGRKSIKSNHQSLISWERQRIATDSFGSCLGHCLKHIEHDVTALTKSLYFKGNLASLAICHLTQVLSIYSGLSIYVTHLLYLLKSLLLGLTH